MYNFYPQQFNIAPKGYIPKKKPVFQTSYFRGYVKTSGVYVLTFKTLAVINSKQSKTKQNKTKKQTKQNKPKQTNNQSINQTNKQTKPCQTKTKQTNQPNKQTKSNKIKQINKGQKNERTNKQTNKQTKKKRPCFPPTQETCLARRGSLSKHYSTPPFCWRRTEQLGDEMKPLSK